MTRICVLNMKGGVGKTTIAIHLAAGFSRRGKRVLLADTDPQGNVSHTLGLVPDGTICELMLGDREPEDLIIRSVRDNLDVLPSSPAAFALDRQLAGETQRETILDRRMRAVSGYDMVVVDTSPSMSLLTFNALLYANHVVIPIGMDLMAVIGARQTMNGIAEVQELWPERTLRVLAVVPTFINASTVASRATLAAINKDPELRNHLFEPGIRQCLDLTYASASRETIWEYAPKSRAAQDFDALITAVEGRLVSESSRKEMLSVVGG
jgi:chromosome partitioning protein